MAAAANTNSESAREREGDSICTWVGQRQAAASSAKRLLAFWRSCVGAELDSDFKDFLKGELKHAVQGPCVQLPCKKGTRLKAQFAPTENIWAGRSESCTAKGFLGPSPASKPGAIQNGKFGTVSTAMVVGLELGKS